MEFAWVFKSYGTTNPKNKKSQSPLKDGKPISGMVIKKESPWKEGANQAVYPLLDRDLQVDALIIGGGITGITAAYLLTKAGKSVALLEKNRIASGETGYSTAHGTYPTDTRLAQLADYFGRNHAQAAWDAQLAAIQKIAEIVSEQQLEVELRHVPGYLFSTFGADVEKEGPELLTESHFAADLGFDVSYVQSAPVVKRPAIRFANQIKFHPGKYLAQLARHIIKEGGMIFENSEVDVVDDLPLRAHANGHTIQCTDVLIATHVPLQGIRSTLAAALFQTKIAAYSTYAMEAQLPPGSTSEALFWDTADPYLYLRFDRLPNYDRLIIGGEDHKTGQQTATEDCYLKLQTTLHALFPEAKIARRWSGQVIETNDGLPFIGEAAPGQFIASGYSGTGITWGTLAAMMFHDHANGIRNPWADLLSASRIPLLKTWDYLRENKDYPYYYLKGLFSIDTEDGSHLLTGEGKIICRKGKKLAAFRREDGALCLHSAICPHMGCVVAWNAAEKTWDCPCHGSRFAGNGQVIAGPAECQLKAILTNSEDS